MNFLQRRMRLKNANYLELTPLRIVTDEIDANNIATILMPRFISRLAQKYLVPRLKAPHIKLKLDPLGSAAWLAIDGKKKVGAIADELTQKFSAETAIIERLTKFFTLLYEQKMVTFKEINRK